MMMKRTRLKKKEQKMKKMRKKMKKKLLIIKMNIFFGILAVDKDIGSRKWVKRNTLTSKMKLGRNLRHTSDL